jgi:hypothetical protein
MLFAKPVHHARIRGSKLSTSVTRGLILRREDDWLRTGDRYFFFVPGHLQHRCFTRYVISLLVGGLQPRPETACAAPRRARLMA